MINRTTTIAKGIFETVSISIISRVISALTNLALISLLAPDAFGFFVGVQSISLISASVTDLGLTQAFRMSASRHINQRHKLLTLTLWMQIAAMLLCGVLALIYFTFISPLGPLALTILSAVLLLQLPESVVALYAIERRFRLAAITDALGVFAVVLGLILFFLFQNFSAFLIGYLSGATIRLIFVLVNLGKFRFLLKLPTFEKKLVREAVPFFLSTVVTKTGIYFGVSYTITVAGSLEAAVIGFPMKIYQLMFILTSLATAVTLPLFHNLYHNNAIDSASRSMARLMGPLWILNLLIGLIPILIPNLITEVIGKSAYSNSSSYLILLGYAFIFKAMSVPFGNILEARGLQWYRLLVQTGSTLIIVILTIALYPKLGVVAVCWAVIIADIFSFVTIWFLNIQQKYFHLELRRAISFLGILIFLVFISDSIQSEFVRYIAVALSLFGLSMIFRLWSLTDLYFSLLRR